MRLLGFGVVLCWALAACELPRPEGAFIELEASLPDAGPTSDMLMRGDATVAPPPPIPGGGIPGTQGGAQTGGQAGMPGGDAGAVGGGPGGADAGAPLSPEEMALKKLEGRYLMRMDMHSTASVRASVITIDTRNLVSHLLVTQLYVENGQLKGNERLCHQVFAHTCVRNCNSLKTTMSPVMTNWFVKMDTPRNYVVSNGMLEGRSNTMALGYDGSMDPRLPTLEDSRVWDSISGGPREGLVLTLDLAAIKNVRCDVYTTQTFVSKFGPSRLSGSADAPSLAGTAKFSLDTTGSDGATLGTNNPDCSADEGPPPTQGEQNVRFLAVGPGDFVNREGQDSFWNCPDATAWDRLTAPTP
jgi:hypothetical protein